MELNPNDIVADELTPDPEPAAVNVGERGTPNCGLDSTQIEADGAAEPQTVPDGKPPESAVKFADTEERFKELLQVIIPYAAVSSQSTAWNFVRRKLGHRIEMSPPEFVDFVVSEFGETILSEIGLHEQVGDDLRLPAWVVKDAVLYLQIDHENHSFKFSGVLQQFPRFALDYAQVQTTKESTSAPETLFVTDSEDSADILRRLGLRSVTCEGLENIGKCDVEKIFAGGHENEWRYYLLLLDFDVASLQNKPTDAIGEVLRRLADAGVVYRIDLAQRFGVCRLDAQDFHRLEKAIAFEDPVQVARLFNQMSMAVKAARVSNWQPYLDVGPVTLFAAHDELIRSIGLPRPFARKAVETALSTYRDTYRNLTRELIKELENSADLGETIEAVAAERSAEAFFEEDAWVRAAECVLADRTPPPMRELYMQAMEQQMPFLQILRGTRIAKKRKR